MSEGLHLLELVTVRWYNACAEYAVTLAAAMAARGHRVVVGGFPDSPPLEAARARGLPVVDSFDFRPGRADGLGTLLRFRRYIRESRFDLINAHRAEDHLFAALALGRRGRTPLVRTRGDVRRPRRHLLNRLLYERYTDAHILAARFMQQRFYTVFRLASDRISTILPGIDVEAFRRGAPDRTTARDTFGLPRMDRVVGLVGRLTAAKGHFVALEAFGQVRRKRPDVRFVISGAPFDISQDLLRERAESLGLGGCVTFLPRLPDARFLIPALDIGVVASVASEAICRVAMEYQALGVPVVGTALNSIPEIVSHGSTGLIVPPGDAGALAGALERLLDEPSLRERLADAGPAHIREHYGLSRLVEATEGLYRRLIRERR